DLCAWKLERGEIKRVPTWHEADAGVELVGDDVAIEQLTPVNYTDGTCIRFDLVANVADNAEVYLDVDVEGDGTLEMHERLPTSHWKPLSYNISIAAPYDGIRFQITKRGAGEAVLANIGANTADAAKCAGLSQLDPGPRRPGAMCDANEECASALCIPSPTLSPGGSFLGTTCGGCDPSSPTCNTGETCGLGDAFSPVFAVPAQCVPSATKELGEKCLSSAECISGGCWRFGASGVCSTCFADGQCPTDQRCLPAWANPKVIGQTGPMLCGAGQGLVASGAPCGADGDCASGHCNGTVRMECDDGRPCSSPAQCPLDDQLKNGACTTVGIQGGSCQ
ncbi:MAG TPA: hypothetical protein VLB44_06400, partial [Kofleriaceae bacterium]|nr:hypothetical protein [Kofleriaceae bacterium]